MENGIVDIISVIIAAIAFIFSIITFVIAIISKSKEDFLKLYFDMMNNEKIYLLIYRLELWDETSNLSEVDIAVLDRYLTYIEIMMIYSEKYSLIYLKREILFIRYIDEIWNYVIMFSKKEELEKYKSLYEKIIKVEKKI